VLIFCVGDCLRIQVAYAAQGFIDGIDLLSRHFKTGGECCIQSALAAVVGIKAMKISYYLKALIFLL
jgi:hypothetical protein